MKLEKLVIGLLLAVCFVSCSKDDEPGSGDDPGKNPNQPENNSSVTINPDGSTSTKAVFSPIDETTFYIDYVKYQIVDSHLEIIGYDPVELKGDVKPYASVKYLGTTYNTRIILEKAFRNCETITNINIPNTVTEIGGSAFSKCSSLISVTIPSSVIKIGDWAFYECRSLISVIIPGSVTEIDNYTFDGCSSLTSVTIPSSVTEIGGYAFYRCSSLKSVTIPSSVTEISNGSFYGGTELSNIYIGGRPSAQDYSFDGSYYCEYSFSPSTCENATLHVKAENLEWFRSHDVWSKFKNIVGDYNP